MIIYLSLKQIILNQIAVLIRQQSSKENDDPERLERRLNYLCQALEQIKSYEHNSNYKYVIKHFNIELSQSEQSEMDQLSAKYGDQPSSNKKRASKTGFTTQRSETVFTGAEEERYGDFYGPEDDDDDEKTPRNGRGHGSMKPPQWIHYKGFAHWLRKQSFIKFKKRNDQEKYRKIWNTITALNFINSWDRTKIKPKNIIGPYGTSQPYIAIHRCGSTDIVKASLLRLSMTQNRIFRFNIKKEEDKRSKSRTRARGSIDMDNEDEYSSGYELSANELIQGRNLFNEVQNKDALRIVATMLWESDLANAVLEELLHNARYSMFGIHAKNMVAQLHQEMNLGTTPSYDNESTPVIDENQEHDKYLPDQSQPHNHFQQAQPQRHVQQQPQQPRQQSKQPTKDITHGNYEQVGNSNVAQFELPPPQRPVSMANAKEISKNQYSGYNDTDSPQSKQQSQSQSKREFRGFVTNDNNNNNGNSYASNQQYTSYNRPNSTSNSASKQSQPSKQNQQMRAKYNNQNNQNNNNKLRTVNEHGNGNGNGNQYGYEHQQSDHARYYNQQQAQNQQYGQNNQQQLHGQGGGYGYKSTPEPIPEESADLPSDSPEKKHKGHSASVVFHDNIRDSQIMDDGAHNYDEHESDDGYEHEDDGYTDDDHMPQNH
eukprot:CAMPEP_0201571506 /NCGR_PEP_ID=MMETSP0190_2-20130828/14313_1 /ASSEMBLY_ACC=CAM_ASM_000263 /TAXON_ID=37353 /ORGANISM="Rosalina sp." /LENGTH=655 /DNA_ID=CAMNT_0047996241 /DNA_START=79 /DNA_END=2046 /DNA_ORIENTATION=-